MPSKKEHAIIGIITGSFVECLKISSGSQTDIGECFKRIACAGLGGYLGGLIPDIIEPATNPNHRGIAHSVATLSVTGCILVKVNKVEKNPYLSAFSRGIGYGVASHIISDATTPKGIPLLK